MFKFAEIQTFLETISIRVFVKLFRTQVKRYHPKILCKNKQIQPERNLDIFIKENVYDTLLQKKENLEDIFSKVCGSF